MGHVPIFTKKTRSNVEFLIFKKFLDETGGMKAKAAPQAVFKARFGLSIGLLAIVGLVSVVLASTAVAAPAIGKGGKISACYRVKGKAKGAMRVVPAGKKCRRGERKLAWNAAGTAGQAGVAGPTGNTGSTGAGGSAGASGTSNEANLQAKIASLTVKVEGLEGLLQGVTTGDLSGVVGKLSGVTGPQLTETVGALPVVSSLCTEAEALPAKVNGIGTALGGITLGGLIPVGLALTIPSVTSLTAYTCPS
jgi:hypothetical protein